MRHETRTKLDEVIVTYQKTVDDSFQGPGEVERIQKHFQALCNDVIRPAMEEFSQVLRDHGHTVRIYGHQRLVDQGGHSSNAELSMHVSPQVSGASADNVSGEFVVSFSFDSAQQKMLARTAAGAAPNSYSHSFDQHPIEGVTKELVEQELLEMLRHGFDWAASELAPSKSERRVSFHDTSRVAPVL